ncbi:hypothetical protein [Streptomyces sp. NPDC048606]|uniref:hypothetical protein n=1 Tax=Streptomyces sp. NPDC048606 TaxID=3154726 RepID=UPI003431A868
MAEEYASDEGLLDTSTETSYIDDGLVDDLFGLEDDFTPDLDIVEKDPDALSFDAGAQHIETSSISDGTTTDRDTYKGHLSVDLPDAWVSSDKVQDDGVYGVKGEAYVEQSKAIKDGTVTQTKTWGASGSVE